MNTGRSQARSTRISAVVIGLFLTAAYSSGVWAMSSVTEALAGTEIATVASGLPLNPAAVDSIGKSALQAGAAVPVGIGNVGYVAFYEPKDPTGMGAALSGMLGVSQTKTEVGRDAITNEMLYHTANSASYQLAEGFPNFGVFGVGVRYLQEKNVSGTTGTAWRLDAGWQGKLANIVTFGVVARDVAGTDTNWGDNSKTPRRSTFHAGVALNVGSLGFLAADATDIDSNGPQAWSTGVAINIAPTATVRAGYGVQAGVEKLTVGAGVRIGTWNVDAASTLGKTPSGSVGVAVEF